VKSAPDATRSCGFAAETVSDVRRPEDELRLGKGSRAGDGDRRTPLAIAVHPSLSVNTIRELLDYAKRNPGRLSYGTPARAARCILPVNR